MAQGIPTLYSEEMQERADEYVLNCTDRIEDGKLKVNLPTVEGMSLELGVSRDTLYEWAKHHSIFSDTLDKLKAKQQNVLISNGLANTYNSTIAKLILSANHGMREKSDITSNDETVAPVLVQFITPDDTADNTDTD